MIGTETEKETDLEMKGKAFTVRFEVDQSWIDDGFNPTDVDFWDALANMLPYAYAHEIDAKIVKVSAIRKG